LGTWVTSLLTPDASPQRKRELARTALVPISPVHPSVLCRTPESTERTRRLERLRQYSQFSISSNCTSEIDHRYSTSVLLNAFAGHRARYSTHRLTHPSWRPASVVASLETHTIFHSESNRKSNYCGVRFAVSSSMAGLCCCSGRPESSFTKPVSVRKCRSTSEKKSFPVKYPAMARSRTFTR
jgi:hypothetical protein